MSDFFSKHIGENTVQCIVTYEVTHMLLPFIAKINRFAKIIILEKVFGKDSNIKL